MSDNDLLALLSAAADGQLGPDERAEMERRLRDHPDAQRFQADLHRMERLLRCVPEELPPEALHRRIIAGLLPSLPARRSVRDWLQHFIPVPVLQYGLAAAAGLLLAVAFYELQPTAQDPPDIDQMVGTIAPARDESDILDSYHLRIRDIDTLVQVSRHDGALLLGIETTTSVPVEIAVDLGFTGLRPEALVQAEPVDSVVLEDRRLRIQALGRGKVTVLLHRSADVEVAGKAGIGVEVSSNGKSLGRDSLQLDSQQSAKAR